VVNLRIGQRVRVVGSETIGLVRRLQSAERSPTREARALLTIAGSGWSMDEWYCQEVLLTDPPGRETVESARHGQG